MAEWTPTKIRRLRKALGLTQEEFARELGVSFSTANRWEHDRKPSKLSVRALDALAKSKRR